jgi:uncharacterized protein
MSVYLDTSALLKRYVAEPDSDRCDQYLSADPDWISARVTLVELRRNLARLLAGVPLTQALEDFERDWRRVHVVEIDATTCDLAAQIAEATLCRSLDALHLAAARRISADQPFLTFDVRQAQVGRTLGLRVLGA